MLLLAAGARAEPAPERLALSLPDLIQPLAGAEPVVPTTVATVSRLTGLYLSPERGGRLHWTYLSRPLELADGARVSEVELAVQAANNHAVPLIAVHLEASPCIAPAPLVARFGLSGRYLNPAPAPGSVTDGGPIPRRVVAYRRAPWGLFALGYNEYPSDAARPSCVTGITLRTLPPEEEPRWP